MNFNVRPSRSMSSTNIGYPSQQNKNSSGKKNILKKESECNQYEVIKQINQ